MTATEALPGDYQEVPTMISGDFKPGIYTNVDRATYNRIPAVSQSMLKPFKRSPAHALERMLHPVAESDAMRLGTLIHTYLLENDDFLNRYIELPDLTQGILTKQGKPATTPKATDEYKARLAAFGQANIGKLFVQPEDMEILKGIGESIAAHSTAASLLSCDGQSEVAVVWECPDTGLLCKALLDRLCTLDGERIVLDVKSCENASLSSFSRDAATYQHCLQVAFYLWGLSCVGEPANRFLHLCIETAPPYGVAVYELDDESIAQGMKEQADYLSQYAECKASGRWPGYEQGIQAARLPRYAITNE